MTPSLEHLHDHLRETAGVGRAVLLLGDMNFDIMNTTSPITRRYTDMLSELGMSQLVYGPTHLHPTPTALDHVITNMQDPVPGITICADAISDHQPVVVSAHLGQVKRARQWRTLRSWRRAGPGTPSVTICSCQTGVWQIAPLTSTPVWITSCVCGTLL